MSYARWGEDSKVYVYASCGGGIECCGCWLDEDGNSVNFQTSGDMIAHLDEHREKGHLVPNYTYEEIRSDYPDLTAIITGDEK